MKAPSIEALRANEESAREAWHAAELKLVRAERAERSARNESVEAQRALSQASVAFHEIVGSSTASLEAFARAERRESKARATWHKAELACARARDNLRSANRRRDRAWDAYRAASDARAALKAGAA